MSIVSMLHDNAGTITGAITAISTAAIFMAKQWWEDRREERLLEPARAAQSELIGLVRKDLEDRRTSEIRSLDVHEKNATSLEKLAEAIRSAIARTDKLDERIFNLEHVKGS